MGVRCIHAHGPVGCTCRVCQRVILYEIMEILEGGVDLRILTWMRRGVIIIRRGGIGGGEGYEATRLKNLNIGSCAIVLSILDALTSILT